MYGNLFDSAFKVLDFWLKWFWVIPLMALVIGIGIGYLIWG